MADLTMLVIVVFLSSLLFVWAVTSFGSYQSGAGFFFSSRSLANQERLSVENVLFYQLGPSYYAKIYVRNVGAIPATIVSVYVNSTLSNIAAQTVNVTQVVLAGSSLTGPGIQLSGPYGKGSLQKITLATQRGSTFTTSWVA